MGGGDQQCHKLCTPHQAVQSHGQLTTLSLEKPRIFIDTSEKLFIGTGVTEETLAVY